MTHDKLYLLGITVLLAGAGLIKVFNDYQNNQCRMEALKLGKPAEEIVQICNK